MLIYLSLIEVYRERAIDPKAGSTVHCVLDETGVLAPKYVRSVLEYAGREERYDLPDLTKRQQLAFRRQDFAHPGELFLSFEEVNAALGKLIEEYNAEAQQGYILDGLSPDQAIQKFWPEKTISRLDANSWHLLSHYVRQKLVTHNGISFALGGEIFRCRNELTDRDCGREVLTWFDPERPELLCITDLNRKNPYVVERSKDPHAMALPNDPVLTSELAKSAAHVARLRAYYNTLKSKFAPSFRRNVVDVETAETAQEIARQRVRVQTEQAIEAKTRNAYRKTGMRMPEQARLDTEAPEDLKRLEDLRRKARAMEPGPHKVGNKTVYVLGPESNNEEGKK